MTKENTQIIQFFAYQTIFLTGGTGFLGKLLIEKLLRVCWDVKKIYVLMRPKRDKTAQQRFEELFDFPCFDLIKHKQVKEKVSLIAGDCCEPRLGLSPEDADLLARETTCVIHAAANVKLDQTLKDASKNVSATMEMLELAKIMPKLKAFVYISTAYSNCIHPHIKEEFYAPPMQPETLRHLVKTVDVEALQQMTPSLLGIWPNTYVFGKCITEELIRRASATIPTAIVRPAIITNTLEEPKAGWIDNIYGFIGVGLGMHLGVVRSFLADSSKEIAVVPADYVCDCILAVTWKIALEKIKSTKIYNCVGRPITIGNASILLQSFYWDFPSNKYVYYKSFTIRTNKFWHNAYNFLYGVLVYLVNFIFLCFGKPTNAFRKFQTLNKAMLLLSRFTTSEWEFDVNNVIELRNEMSDEDKKIFKFYKDIDWYSYVRTCCLGIRLYLLNDPVDTLPKGQRKLRILFIVHYLVLAFVYYLTYLLLKSMLSFCLYS